MVPSDYRAYYASVWVEVEAEPVPNGDDENGDDEDGDDEEF